MMFYSKWSFASTRLLIVVIVLLIGSSYEQQQFPNSFGNYPSNPWGNFGFFNTPFFLGGSQFQQNPNGGGGNPFGSYGIPNPSNNFNFPFGNNYQPGGVGTPNQNGQIQPVTSSKDPQQLQNPSTSQIGQPVKSLPQSPSFPQQGQPQNQFSYPGLAPFGSWPYNSNLWPTNQLNPQQIQPNFWPNSPVGQGQTLQQQHQANPWNYYNPFYPQVQGQPIPPQLLQPVLDNKAGPSPVQAPTLTPVRPGVSEIVGPNQPQPAILSNSPPVKTPEIVGPRPQILEAEKPIEVSEIVGPHPPQDSTLDTPNAPTEVTEITGPHPTPNEIIEVDKILDVRQEEGLKSPTPITHTDEKDYFDDTSIFT